MRLNTLFNIEHQNKKSKRVGRGVGSGKGKTSGSGHKGQRARTGVAIKGFEGGQMPIYRRLPKRGFNNFRKVIFKTVNLSQIEALLKHNKLSAENITKFDLLKAGLISNYYKPVKLLASGGVLTHKIKIEADDFSEKAKELIEKNGGSAIIAAYEEVLEV